MRNLTLEITCPFCNNVNEVLVNEQDFNLYSEMGYLVQDAFPYLGANEREMIISGICPKCWDNMF